MAQLETKRSRMSFLLLIDNMAIDWMSGHGSIHSFVNGQEVLP